VDPAGIEELAIEQSNPAIDPCLFASSVADGACVDHGIEIAIDSYLEPIGADCLGETLRYDQAIERENATYLGIDPENILVESALRHRKQADGIGAEQNIAGYLELVAGMAHRARLSVATDAVKRERSGSRL
jgi:hypothetical protein